MDKGKAIEYIESSFLSSVLNEEDVTDISYNGSDFYYVTNLGGRKKCSMSVEHQYVKDFLRQIANLSEQQFSFSNPILDISIGKYRINAVHQSIGKIKDDDVVTFSIRIASSKPRINDDSDFFTPQIVALLKELLINRQSIVIGGLTSSGKTEFQKYLLRNMNENERIIVIDNVTELDSVRDDNNIDLTCWRVDERNPYSSCSVLIKNALRNNPDWLILAEARDKEMFDVLNSAMTGAPIITTIHSHDVKSLPFRMGRMVQRCEQKMDYNEVLNDIYYHFHFYVYLTKEEKKKTIKRYISEIGFINSEGRFYYLYKKEKNQHKYYRLPEEALYLLKNEEFSKVFEECFIKRGERNEQ